MNLVVLTRQFGTYTGATISTIELLKKIRSNFNRVVVVTMRSEVKKISGVEIELAKDRGHLQSKLCSIVQDGNWIGYSDDHYGWMLKNVKIPYIHTYHGNWPDARYLNTEMFLKSFYFIPQYKQTIMNSEITVSVSKYMQTKFVDNYAKRSTVIYNGIRQNQQIKQLKKTDRILMVGNVDSRKYSLAVKLFNKVNSNQIPQIDIYGSILDKKISKKLSRFSFVNVKGKKDHINYGSYSKLLSTSLSENLPVSIVEALLQKVPVISFDVGGINEVVTENSGKIIPLHDFSLMLNEITTTKSYSFRNLDNLKKEFNWDYSAKKYMELFKQIGIKE